MAYTNNHPKFIRLQTKFNDIRNGARLIQTYNGWLAATLDVHVRMN